MSKTNFNRSNPCPICNGYDSMERGKGKRCHGFLSSDEKYANCSREEYAGLLTKNLKSDTYGHKLKGNCNCGVRHDPSPAKQLVATYDYKDEQGKLLYQVVRYEPKAFLQRQPDGKGSWVWKLDGVRRVLYRLPELLAADPQETVFIVEGEKDANRLSALGLVVTTNVSGAGKWRDEYNEYLCERHVVILPDNDQKGRDHARLVAASLQGKAQSMRIVLLPDLPEKGDVSDWLSKGGTPKQLIALCESTEPFSASESGTVSNDEAVLYDLNGDDEQQPTNDADEDIDVCMADVEPEEVEWLIKPYIPLGKLTMVEGDPDEGKSFAMLAIVAAITRGHDLPFAKVSEAGNVILLSAEDGHADTLRPRLDSLDADVGRVFAARMPIVLDDKGFEQLEGMIVKRRAKLVLIDPVFAFIGAKTDNNQDNKVRAITNHLNMIAEKNRCAIVALRHLSKADQRNAKSAGSGSIAWTAAARSVLLFGHEPNDEQLRGFVHTKHNLSKAGMAQGYRIDEVNGGPYFRWTGESNLTDKKILSSFNDNLGKSELSKAEDFLFETLQDGAVLQKEVARLARREKISSATLRRAKDKLCVISERQQPNGLWLWKLPDAQDAGHTNEHVAEGKDVVADSTLYGTIPDAQMSRWDNSVEKSRCSNEHVEDQLQTLISTTLTPLIPDAQIGSPGALSM